MPRTRPLLARGVLALALPLAIGAAAVRAQDAPGGTSSVQVSEEGQQVYEQICQSCHMADAKGGSGAGAGIPSLAGNANLASKDYIAGVVYHGRGGMPWFKEMLTEQQIAAVSTYVRAHFNAHAEPVTIADVQRVAAADGAPVAVTGSGCTCN